MTAQVDLTLDSLAGAMAKHLEDWLEDKESARPSPTTADMDEVALAETALIANEQWLVILDRAGFATADVPLEFAADLGLAKLRKKFMQDHIGIFARLESNFKGAPKSKVPREKIAA